MQANERMDERRAHWPSSGFRNISTYSALSHLRHDLGPEPEPGTANKNSVNVNQNQKKSENKRANPSKATRAPVKPAAATMKLIQREKKQKLPETEKLLRAEEGRKYARSKVSKSMSVP